MNHRHPSWLAAAVRVLLASSIDRFILSISVGAGEGLSPLAGLRPGRDYLHMTPDADGPSPLETPDAAVRASDGGAASDGTLASDGGAGDPFDGGTPDGRRTAGTRPPPVSAVPAPSALPAPGQAPSATAKRRVAPGLFRLVALVVTAAIVGAGTALLVARATGWGSETVVRQYVATGGAVSGHPADMKALLATALPSVVAVKAVSDRSNPFFNPRGGETVTAEGTGVVVSGGGEILTNAHVVSGASSVTVTFNDASEHAATILATDTGNDLALLKVSDATGLPPLELGDSGSVAAGDGVIAIGYALGLEGGPSVTAGIISATGRTTSTETGFGAEQTLSNLLQTDASISSGDSGGPLLDAEGHMIGINTMVATSTSSTAANGIGFAIASDTVKSVLPGLRAR